MASSGICESCGNLAKTFESEGAELAKDKNRTHSISACVVRATGPNGDLWAGIDGNHPVKDQINVVIDVLHWWYSSGQSHERLGITLDKPKPEAAHAVQTLVDVLNQRAEAPSMDLNIRPRSDKTRVEMRSWTDLLRTRMGEERPALLKKLDSLVGPDHPGLVWYPGLTSRDWSGRVEGIEVAKIWAGGRKGRIFMGGKKEPRQKSAVRAFRDLIDAEGFGFGECKGQPLAERSLEQVAEILKKLAIAREEGGVLYGFYPEHRLESRILREDVAVRANSQILEPVNTGSQFPTAWSPKPDGHARYLDALMKPKDGSKIPWAAEIKIAPKSGLNRYYRHGIPQAVLYREYIRSEPSVREFFLEDLGGLDAAACEAALIVPEDSGPHFGKQSREELETLASLFSAHVVTV